MQHHRWAALPEPQSLPSSSRQCCTVWVGCGCADCPQAPSAHWLLFFRVFMEKDTSPRVAVPSGNLCLLPHHCLCLPPASPLCLLLVKQGEALSSLSKHISWLRNLPRQAASTLCRPRAAGLVGSYTQVFADPFGALTRSVWNWTSLFLCTSHLVCRLLSLLRRRPHGRCSGAGLARLSGRTGTDGPPHPGEEGLGREVSTELWLVECFSSQKGLCHVPSPNSREGNFYPAPSFSPCTQPCIRLTVLPPHSTFSF